jgi:energy-coupling factor transporter ATP-binding protein EcfA2
VTDRTLLALVVERLAAAPPTVEGAEQLVLAAFEHDSQGSEDSPHGHSRVAADGVWHAGHAGMYLRGVEVAGFRGVGRSTTLELAPGPGLTVVVGRNGSGKSSLAEALEMLLTGANRRWTERPKVWSEGWRNLHHGPPRIVARFAIEGRSAPLRMERTWPDGAALGASQLSVDGRPHAAGVAGWASALRDHPPLLSHNELGRILEGRPTDLYDSLASILGLADIAEAEARLRDLRLGAERLVREQQRAADEIGRLLVALDDQRAAACAAALSGKAWDLDAVQRAVSGGIEDVEERSALRVLRELSGLPIVDRAVVAATVARLREVHDELGRVGGSDAAIARETAVLLEQALRVHTPGHGQECPLCGTPGMLSYDWRLRTVERAAALRREAAEVEAVHASAALARAEARALITAAPRVLDEAAGVGIDATPAATQWRRWMSPPDDDDPGALATHLASTAPDLIAAVAAVRAAAGSEVDRREDRWRPIAQNLVAWLPAARAAETARAQLPRLKAAEAWLRDAHGVLREQRFDPIAEQVQANWRELRQTSSVQLGRLRLEGTGTSTQRRLALDVSIDGEEGSALGVMSQGELNCLALSLFLPRASMPESPFRFVVIDDPVQAMDPVKVEGLARVLGRVAHDRQVIVLTHDDRLPDAVRRLEMEATIVEVTRRDHSVVELRTVLDPVSRHIGDAMAVAMSRHLPAAAHRVVPGFCRLALEAACVRSVTHRLRHEGRTHDEVETALAAPTTLLMWLALALLKDAQRSGDVMALLNRKHPWAADAVALANRGAHVAVGVDLVSLVRTTEQLAQKIAEAGGAGQ